LPWPEVTRLVLRRRAALRSRGRDHPLDPAIFDHPPEQLFDMLADIRNEPTWQPDVPVGKLTDGLVGPGSRFRDIYKGLADLDVEIAE
jgi:hypothetical protein